MDGQHAPPMPSLASFYPAGYPPTMPPGALQPRLHHLPTLSADSLGHHFHYDDQPQPMGPASGPPRVRRRTPQGVEHVKHRRTRSGCYTCRQRRVKVGKDFVDPSFVVANPALAQCDETRPVCERCRKGKRECAYPGTTASSSSSARLSANAGRTRDATGSPSSSASDVADDERDGGVTFAAVEEDDETGHGDDFPSDDAAFAHAADPSSALKDRPPLRPRALTVDARQPSSATRVLDGGRWAALPNDVKFLLRYHRDSLSYHHYAFKYDGNDFLKTTFLEIALKDTSEALLYAIVSFAAYHYALGHDGEKIYPFLTYYNRSITCLQQSLMSRRHSVATLLTILQLATIEEFLGDWVNLFGHQRAAHQIMTDLFTPQTIMQDETRRKIIAWYIRFDIFAGILSGCGTTIGREWFAACADFYTRRKLDRPDDIGAQFEQYFATARLLATDATLLFAAVKQDELSHATFLEHASRIASSMREFGREVESAWRDPASFVKDFSKAPAPSDEDIVDYRDPSFVFAGNLSTMNFVLMDFWGIQLMFNYQLSMAQQQPLPSDLGEMALKQCKMFEAVQYLDQGPSGVVLGCQASLGLSSMFLPKDRKHNMWCRRKLAAVEQLGYIYPASLRKQLSDMWQEDVTRWWLPNDEGYPEIVRTIREFIEYRATIPTDQSSARLRDISGVFRYLRLEEAASPYDMAGRAGPDGPPKL